MKCPRCQQENPPQAKFCLGCGAPLDATAAIGGFYAELQVENERLQRAVAEASAQQTATSEILRVISSSPTDTQPVFETIAATALRLCNAKLCTVFRFDGKLIHLVALHQASMEGAAAYRDAYPAPPGRAGGTHRAILTRGIVHIPDIREDPEYELQALARANDFGCVLSVPMLRDGRPVGAITVGREAGRSFSDEQIELLKTFASQALIAIENVRLFNETKEALEQQTATGEILRVIARSPTDIQPVLDTVAERAARLCESFDSAIWRQEGEHLRLVAHHGPIPATILPIVRGTIAGRAVLEARTLHFANAQSEGDEFPESSVNARREGWRSILSVPLIREGVATGAIVLRRTEARLFTERQVALLQTFADQAVIAIENVRLFTELQSSNRELTAALDQQTATSEILRVISSSPTDVHPVFDTIVQSAARLCHAANAGVFLTDGRTLDLPANYGSSSLETLAILRAQYPRPLDLETTAGVAILTRSVIHVPDIEEPSAAGVYTRRVGRLLGVRSMVAVPMMRKGEVVGAINLSRQEPGRFLDAEVELLKTFADQAVIAIENVRLFTELQDKNRALTESLDQQTATGEILRVISSSPTDVQPVFEAIVRAAVRLCQAVQSNVQLFDGQLMHFVAAHNIGPAAMEMIQRLYPMPPNRNQTGSRAVLDNAVMRVPDVLEDPEYLRELAVQGGWRSVLSVPMVGNGRPIGAITVTRMEPGRFSDAEVELLNTFADQAVIAIENVRLFNETKETLERQTATAEILRVIAGSPTNAQPVFDAIADSAVRLCGAAFSRVFRFDGEQIHFAAHAGLTPEELEATRRIFPQHAIPGATGISRVVLQGTVVQIADVQDDAEWQSFVVSRSLNPFPGYRTFLAVPLMRGAVCLGAINVWRREVSPFSEQQIELLKTFADQAVIAIENVRLFKELEARNRDLSEALEQQTATAEILRVISASPTDLAPVFDAILANACRLCGANFAALWRVSGRELLGTASYNASPEFTEHMKRNPIVPSRKGPTRLAALERRTVHIADMTVEPGFSPVNLHFEKARTVLSVPLMHDAALVGVLSMWRREVCGFTEQQIALVQTFADQAVIAIENVRLFTELQARTTALTRSVDELRALSEVGQAISSTLDLDAVLHAIVARATHLSGTDAGVIYEYDAAREIFVPRATEHLEVDIVDTMLATPVRKGEGATGRLADVQEPNQVPDILAAPADSRVRGALVRTGYRALLAVPLVREQHLLGGLTVIRKTPGSFSAQVIELLRTFATQSALAIQNARLFREIEQKSRELEAASHHKSEFLANMSHELRTPLNAVIGFSEVLNERMFGDLNEKQDEYLKDIHASGQHLLSLINDILDLSKIEAGRMELEPADFDLPGAIDDALTLVRERAARRGIMLGQAIDERVGTIRADQRKVKQVLLNLLSNAIKFTPDGGRIDVQATVNDGMAEVSVTDSGVGIAPEDQEAVFEEFRQVGTAEKKAEGTGLGLTLCRKFVELHGGRIWVKSQIGAGSTFSFTIPVRRGE